MCQPVAVTQNKFDSRVEGLKPAGPVEVPEKYKVN